MTRVLFTQSSLPAVATAILFIAFPLLWFPALPDAALIPRLTVLGSYLLIACLWLYFRRTDGLRHVIRDPALIIYAVYVFLFVLSFSWSDYFPIDIERGLLALFAIQLFVVFSLLVSYFQGAINLVLKSIVIASCISFLLGIYDILINLPVDDGFFSYIEKIKGILGDKNLYSSSLFLVLPFLGITTFRLGKYWRYSAYGLIIINIGIIAFLQSRAVWLAMMAGLIIVMAAYILAKPWGKSIAQHLYTQLFSFLGLVSSAIVIILMIAVSMNMLFPKYKFLDRMLSPVVDRVETKDIHSYTIRERLQLWGQTLEMIQDNPIMGSGGGDWPIEHRKYGIDTKREGRGRVYMQRPHNDFLWIWSEAGLLCFLCYVFPLLYAVVHLVVQIVQHPSRQVAALLLFGVVGFIVISFFSFPQERPVHVMYSTLLLAFSFFMPSARDNKGKPLPLKSTILFVAMLNVSAIGVCIYKWQSGVIIEKGLKARALNHYSETVRMMESATTPLSQYGPTATPLSYYIGEVHFYRQDYNKALATFQEAKKQHPWHLQTMNSLGSVYARKENKDQAIDYYEEALSLSPYFDEALINLATLKYKNNEVEQAKKLIGKVSPHTNNRRFSKVVDVVYSSLIDSMVMQENNQLISKTMKEIRSEQRWLEKLQKDVHKKNETFRIRVIKDVVYKLEQIDSIPGKTSKRIRDRFDDIQFDYEYTNPQDN